MAGIGVAGPTDPVLPGALIVVLRAMALPAKRYASGQRNFNFRV
jgi:hypothetical protein